MYTAVSKRQLKNISNRKIHVSNILLPINKNYITKYLFYIFFYIYYQYIF